MIQQKHWKNFSLSHGVLILALFLFNSFTVKAQSYNQLNHLDGVQTNTFYSDKALEQAKAMAQSIDDATDFYKKEIGFKPEVTLLVLSSEDWGTHTDYPVYGMPHYTDDQTLVVASENNSFWKAFLPSKEELPTDLAKEIQSTYTNSNGNLSLRPFFDLIAIHELGHAYHIQGGLNMQRKWMGELFCNVFLHTYIAENVPQLLPALTVFPKMLVTSVDENELPYTSLEELEANYNNITVENPHNYGWYQCRLHRAAENIYEEGGVKALRNLWIALKNHENELDDTSFVTMLSEEVDESVSNVILEWD